jgi:hypothetical protein
LSVVMCDDEGSETQYNIEEDFPSDIIRLATSAMKPAARMPPRDSTLKCGIFKVGQKAQRRDHQVTFKVDPTLALSISDP